MTVHSWPGPAVGTTLIRSTIVALEAPNRGDVNSAEKVMFGNSGSEVTHVPLRPAQAFTGRRTISIFQGCSRRGHFKPLPRNIGCVLLPPEYSHSLRDFTRQHGNTPIINAIFTGLRLAPAGYLNHSGVPVGLTARDKAFANGHPPGVQRWRGGRSASARETKWVNSMGNRR